MSTARRITSRQHPIVRECREAARHPARGDVLLDGEHLIEDALTAGVTIRVAIAEDGRHATLIDRAGAAGAEVFGATPLVMAAASPVRQPSGIVALATWQAGSLEAAIRHATGPLLGLVGVQDPGNVGSAIRAADALEAGGVLALDATAHPGGWKALRGAMGSTFRLPVGRGTTEELLAMAAAGRVRLVAAVPRGGSTAVGRQDAGVPVVVLVGNEGAGLEPDLIERATQRISVPMRAGVESLNVAVCAALVLDRMRSSAGTTGRDG